MLLINSEELLDVNTFLNHSAILLMHFRDLINEHREVNSQDLEPMTYRNWSNLFYRYMASVEIEESDEIEDRQMEKTNEDLV